MVSFSFTTLLGFAQIFWSKFFAVCNLHPTLFNIADVLTALVISLTRFGVGQYCASGIGKCKRPQKPLILYEYEGCPFCKKVREVLSVLDLDCIIYPCPRETFKAYGVVKDSRFRNKVKSLGGKVQFPFLIDNNTNQQLYESDTIINYLLNQYGDKCVLPKTYKYTKFFNMIGYRLGMIFRCLPQHGLLRIPSKEPKQMLELYSFETSPFCKIVRETLSCLELPYILHNVPRGSIKKRQEFLNNYGDRLSSWRKSLNLIQVPFLIDPNTNTELFESRDIVNYLLRTYKTGSLPNESYFDYTTQKKD